MLKRPTSVPKQARKRKVYLYVGDEVRYAWDSLIDWQVARRALDWARMHETEKCSLSNSRDMPVKESAKQVIRRNRSSAGR